MCSVHWTAGYKTLSVLYLAEQDQTKVSRWITINRFRAFRLHCVCNQITNGKNPRCSELLVGRKWFCFDVDNQTCSSSFADFDTRKKKRQTRGVLHEGWLIQATVPVKEVPTMPSWKAQTCAIQALSFLKGSSHKQVSIAQTSYFG